MSRSPVVVARGVVVVLVGVGVVSSSFVVVKIAKIDMYVLIFDEKSICMSRVFLKNRYVCLEYSLKIDIHVSIFDENRYSCLEYSRTIENRARRRDDIRIRAHTTSRALASHARRAESDASNSIPSNARSIAQVAVAPSAKRP